VCAMSKRTRFNDRHWLSLIAAKSRNARVRKSARREFILARDGLVTVKAVLERAYVRQRPRRFKSWHYHSVRRALRSLGAMVVARNRFGRGRPSLWALADTATEGIAQDCAQNAPAPSNSASGKTGERQ